jgi:hypothetical protein
MSYTASASPASEPGELFGLGSPPVIMLLIIQMPNASDKRAWPLLFAQSIRFPLPFENGEYVVRMSAWSSTT